MDVWQSKKSFRDLLETDGAISAFLRTDDIDEIFDLKKSIRHVDMIFERVGLG
jgi:adenylosuccinate lyase